MSKKYSKKRMTVERQQIEQQKEYYSRYEDLVDACKPLYDYYQIDKIKPYAVYVWTETENVFDIEQDTIQYWVDDHEIPPEVFPIIKDIQKAIRAVQKVGK